MTRFHSSAFCLSALALLAACSGPKIDQGQYWQRSSTSEAIYAQGPKAQQMLNRDISRCVIEIRELEGLGAIKDAIPTDSTGRVLDPDERKMADWDTPERDGQLLAEHTDYTDFEGCMLAQGWERVKYVPYEVATKARRTWFRSHVDYGEDPADARMYQPTEHGPYGGLND